MNRENVKDILNGKILGFFACIVIFAVFSQIYKAELFPYDSGHYWSLSSSLVNDGKFDLSGFPLTFRGYAFALILLATRSIGVLPSVSGIDSYYLLTPILFSLVFAVILPRFIFDVCGVKATLRGIILFALLINVFWYGLIVYPLSDMWSCAALIITVSLLHKTVNGTPYSVKTLIYSFLGGAASYLAYNIRTVNVFSLFLSLVCIVVLSGAQIRLRGGGGGKRAAIIILFLSGILVTALPQIYINYNHHSGLSPFVITNQFGADGSRNLYVSQLLWGLHVQKYETYIGPPEDFPSPSVVFYDNAGIEIQNKIDQSEFTFIRYVLLFLSNIPAFLGIYGRHIINLLDQRYPEVYITDLFKPRTYLTLLNYAVWFAACLHYFIAKNETKPKKSLYIYALIFILPSLAAIPGAPETRFFLPVYILAYLYVCFIVDYKKIFRFIISKPLMVGAVFIAGFTIFCAITGSTMASLRR